MVVGMGSKSYWLYRITLGWIVTVGVYGGDIGSFICMYIDYIVVVYCETNIDLL